MHSPPLVSVNLATVAVESLLYGIFLVLSGASVYFYCTRANRQGKHGSTVLSKYTKPVFCGSMLMTCTITGVSSCDLCHVHVLILSHLSGAH